MNDYLDNSDSGSDWMSGDGGYLGLDDPAMPTEAPEPPTAPVHHDNNGGGDWMSGDSSWSSEPQAPAASDDWMSGAESAPVDGGYFDVTSKVFANPRMVDVGWGKIPGCMVASYIAADDSQASL